MGNDENFMQFAIEIFEVYLGIDASYGKMDLKFMIPDPENPRGRIFSLIENFGEKRWTHIRVVPIFGLVSLVLES